MLPYLDFQAPTSSDELSLKEGDVVIVLSDEREGMYKAEVDGKTGLVPAQYVAEYTPKHPVRSDNSLKIWLLTVFFTPFA